MTAMVFRSRRVRAAIASVVLAAALTQTGAAESQPTGLNSRTKVPAILIAESSKNYDSFALALATQKIPAGFVVTRQSDSQPLHRAGPQAIGAPSAADLISIFEERHSAYSARIQESTFAVRPKAANACTAALTRPTRAHVFATSLRDSVQILLHDINPTIPLPGPQQGSVGSSLSKPDDPRSAPSQVPVALTIGPGTLEQSLNSFVRSVPGTVWLLEASQDAQGGVCRLRLIRESGAIQFNANLAR